VLSALGEVDDRVEGLRSGGDDYLIKPYAFAELLARLEALVRRRIETKTLTYLKVSDLELNQLNHKVSRASRSSIGCNRRAILPHETLGTPVAKYSFTYGANWISPSRSKIDKDFDKPLLHTLRGIGYKLDELA
jgi:two-component system OmpR family response regulator